VPSRLEKSEQLVSVATHSPITTHTAARNGKEERVESIPCTIILIQKSIERAQLTVGTDPVCLVYPVSLVSLTQSNKLDRPNRPHQQDRLFSLQVPSLTGPHPSAKFTSMTESLLPAPESPSTPRLSWSAISRLIRLQNQTGTWLLMFPTLWSLSWLLAAYLPFTCSPSLPQGPLQCVARGS